MRDSTIFERHGIAYGWNRAMVEIRWDWASPCPYLPLSKVGFPIRTLGWQSLPLKIHLILRDSLKIHGAGKLRPAGKKKSHFFVHSFFGLYPYYEHHISWCCKPWGCPAALRHCFEGAWILRESVYFWENLPKSSKNSRHIHRKNHSSGISLKTW